MKTEAQRQRNRNNPASNEPIAINRLELAGGRKRDHAAELDGDDIRQHLDREWALGSHVELLDDPKVQRWLGQLTRIRKRWAGLTFNDIKLLEAEWLWREKERKFYKAIEAYERRLKARAAASIPFPRSVEVEQPRENESTNARTGV